ncbi:DUF2178 domain-containing protein [Halobacteriales archaeon SW_12_69_24]|nr:MAG: DUF2178 domain-containing protein [Halobacteriales archaeon SW_12_69_24]
MYGSLAVGFVGYVAGLRAELPVVALAVYWVGFLGFLAVWKGSSVTLFDERHAAMEAKTAKRTLNVAGAALILVAPAVPALQSAGYGLPTLAEGALYGYAALFGVYGLLYTVIRVRT